MRELTNHRGLRRGDFKETGAKTERVRQRGNTLLQCRTVGEDYTEILP